MDARIVEKHDVAATLEVTIPAEGVDAAFERVLRTLARQLRLPGFRPGKVPRGVLIQKVGAEALAEEVRDALVDEHYPKAVQELGLTPIHAHTHADAPKAGEAFTFTVHADLYPEFTLADVDDIVIDTTGAPISDDDVAATIARLRDDHATLVPMERPVEPGDVVYVETQGEGGGQTMPVDLERTEAALVDQLLGKAVGDELVLDLGLDPTPVDAGSSAEPSAESSPEPSPESTDESASDEDLAATDAASGPVRRSLAVRVTDVKAKERPETDDAFAATLGFASWADVDAEIRRGLGIEREREILRAQRDELVEKLMVGTELGLPTSLVRRRQAHLLEDLAADLQRRGLTMEAYLERLESRGEREGFERELREAAERGVKRDLVLERLLEVRGTTVGDAELDAAIRHTAMRERKDPVKFRRDAGETWIENFRFLLARDKALDELVREKTGRGPAQDAEAAVAEAADAAADGADAATDEAYDDDHDTAHRGAHDETDADGHEDGRGALIQ
jgi:trigger factor